MFQRGNVGYYSDINVSNSGKIGYYSNINVSNSGMWRSISLINYAMDDSGKHNLTKLMVQVGFEQKDLHWTYEFEHAMDHRYQALVSKLEALHAIAFANCPEV